MFSVFIFSSFVADWQTDSLAWGRLWHEWLLKIHRLSAIIPGSGLLTCQKEAQLERVIAGFTILICQQTCLRIYMLHRKVPNSNCVLWSWVWINYSNSNCQEGFTQLKGPPFKKKHSFPTQVHERMLKSFFPTSNFLYVGHFCCYLEWGSWFTLITPYLIFSSQKIFLFWQCPSSHLDWSLFYYRDGPKVQQQLWKNGEQLEGQNPE